MKSYIENQLQSALNSLCEIKKSKLTIKERIGLELAKERIYSAKNLLYKFIKDE